MKKQETVIHVGLSKTGTTFLQNFVFPRLNVNFVNGFSIFDKLDKDKLNLISDETFSNDCLLNNCDNRLIVADRLHSLFPNAKVMIVLRERKTFINSMYSEYIKFGGIKSKKQWIDDCENVNPDAFNFKKYVDHLEKLFKKGVLVLDFALLKEDYVKFVIKICKFIDVDIPKLDNKRVNVRLGEKTLQHWRIMNMLFKSSVSSGGLFPRFCSPLFWYKEFFSLRFSKGKELIRK